MNVVNLIQGTNMKKIEREVLATIPMAAGCANKDAGNNNGGDVTFYNG